MIFIDTNVFVYSVGRPHPNQDQSRDFLMRALRDDTPLYTSVEVLQELMHVLFSVGRVDEFDTAMELINSHHVEVLPLELPEIVLARELRDLHPTLSARDLCHLASCRTHGIRDLFTFDRSLRQAFYESGETV